MVKQRGVTILESLIGLAVISAVIVASMHFFANMVKDRIDDSYAEQMQIIGKATEDYLKKEFNTDVTGFGKSVNTTGVITVSELTLANLLPDNFNTNMSSNPYSISWRRDGTFPGYTIRALIESKVDNQVQAKNIAKKLGANGGSYVSGLASGSNSGYSFSNSHFSNIGSSNNNSVFYLAEYVHAEKSNKLTACFVDANVTHRLNRVTILRMKIVGGGGGGGGAHTYKPPFYKRGVAANCYVNTTTQQWDCYGGETVIGPLATISNLNSLAPYYNDTYWQWYFSATDWRASGPGTIVQNGVNFYGSKGNQGTRIDRLNEYIHVPGDVVVTIGSGGQGGVTYSPTEATPGTPGSNTTVSYNGTTLTASGGSNGLVNAATSAQDYDAGHNLGESACNAIATNFGRGGRGGVSVDPSPNYGGGPGSSGAVFIEYLQW